MKALKILAFDTTGNFVSVAVLEGSKILSQKEIIAQEKQAEMLVPTIEECLNEAQIWYQDLDLLAVTNGPGSFTAIRIGFVCAKALKLATGLPLIAVNSLEAIAYPHKNSGQKKIFAAIDAKLDELFIQEFLVENNSLQPLSEARLISISEIKNFLPTEKFLLCGNAEELIADSLTNHNYISNPQNDGISAVNIALLAAEIYQKSGENNSAALYIRKPRISERKK